MSDFVRNKNAEYIKDPDAFLDYLVNWAVFLPEGDVIIDSTFTSDSVELVVEISTFTDTTTTVWVSGGELGMTHKVVNHITTQAGRQEDQTLVYTIKEK